MPEWVMVWKAEAAYHEAGHAVLAHMSDFHVIGGPINLARHGYGGVVVGLSGTKCLAARKPATPDVARDPEVARDFAVILTGGYAAELTAAAFDPTLIPDLACAQPDYESVVEVLAAAGLSRRFDRFQAQAMARLSEYWPQVERLAQYLRLAGQCSAAGAESIISPADPAGCSSPSARGERAPS
jgi:hypothetical protein